MPRATQPISPTVASTPPTQLFAGTSGWAYPTWKSGFYPPEIPQKKFLEFYASQMNSVEVNYTFRTLPTAKMLEGWIAATPPHFRFSFKAPQRITHFKRLVDCNSNLAEFLEVLAPVREANRLGLLVFQLPPNFKADPARLKAFLSAPALRTSPPALAFEFRHESFFSEATYAILRAHNAALCIADTDDLKTPEVHTASTHTCFRLRRHGGYSAREISAFAQRFRHLAETRETYVYFRHEDEPTGALNAAAFIAAAGGFA